MNNLKTIAKMSAGFIIVITIAMVAALTLPIVLGAICLYFAKDVYQFIQENKTNGKK